MNSLAARKRWNLFPAAPPELLNATPEHPLLVQVLHNRGLRTPQEIAAFLNGADAVAENPYRLRDVDRAVERILRAVDTGETICVYGDFDADGVTSTALLVTALQAAGARVGPYIPDRVDEGYGLNVDAIERIAAQAQLIITVDCGMRSIAEVQRALDLGVDVIVTDHHTCGPVLPPAHAVINPRRPDCPSGALRLAGVGVTYRLAQAALRALAARPGAPITPDQAAELEEVLLDYVALGTVADMMPLLGENRILVRRGLAQLNTARRPGVAALMQQAGLRPGGVDAAAISFRLAPRINAAGRLAHARLAYNLLRTRDGSQAYELSCELETLNQRRQSLTVAAQSEAEAQLAADGQAGAPLVFVAGEGFLPGIVGLVAGKLVERYYRPAVVVEQGESESRGSARSIREFDISRALDEVSGLLVRHGGHSRAAGFTVRTERLPELAEALRGVAAAALAGETDLRPSLDVDAEVALDDLNWSLLDQFARLEPTGQENSAPLLFARKARLREAWTVGDGKHVRLTLDAGAPAGMPSPVLDAVAFQQADRMPALKAGGRLDLVFTLEANEYQGRRTLQLNVQDMRKHEPEA
jgi:single-stranded-DNA-specific exonuclease